MLQVSTTQCRVSLFAPNGRQFAFAPAEVSMGLLHVETEKDLGEAVGSFTLTFDGREDQDGRRWDERIPRRSLVFIHMERPRPSGASSANGATQTEGDSTVMIGLTDVHAMQESYVQAAPRRQVVLRGRELSCVLLDAMLWYHPALATNPGYGTMTFTDAKFGAVLLSFIADPKLVGQGLTPQAALQTILDRYLFRGGAASAPSTGAQPEGGMPLPKAPLINLSLPNMGLADVLDPNYAAWSTFQPVIVPGSHFPTEAGSLWNYLHLYIDRNFQEFFTRMEEGQCRIHFRGKPFLHKNVTSGTRFKSSGEPGDTPSPTTEPTLQTIVLNPDDILSQQLGRDTGQVYNVFLVLPRAFSDAHRYTNMRYLINPQAVTDAEHPSFVGRYGVRLMLAQSMYLAPLGASPPSAPAQTPKATPQPLKSPPAGAATYAPMANQIAAEQGIPPALRPWFVASIEQESGFNPNAQGTSGEQGMAQFMPATAAHFGVTNPYDPVQALTGAAKYWNELRADPLIGDNPQLILSGYNAGPGAVHAAGGQVPASAAAHVRNVTARTPRYVGYAGSQGAAAPPANVPAQPTPAPGSLASADPMVKLAEQWAAILKAWYDMGGELFSGTLVVRGSPVYNVGHRLVCQARLGDWEAYIEGVQHSYDVRTGQYVTTLRITRGWPLSPAWTLHLVADGETTITDASGGPPDVDPGEGPGLGPELEGA